MGRTATTEEPSGQKMMLNFSKPEKTLVLADGAKQGGFGLIEPGGPLPDPDRYEGKIAALMLDGSARIMDAGLDFKPDSAWFTPENYQPETAGAEEL